jgi:hypothetical protein
MRIKDTRVVISEEQLSFIFCELGIKFFSDTIFACGFFVNEVIGAQAVKNPL